MSLQICINCKELAMTWYMDDDDRTWWSCSECDFEMEEDESKECRCRKCNSLHPFVSWMMKDGEGFYWCFACNTKTDQVTNESPTLEECLRELEKLKS
jgi:hypothetical protein